MCKERKKCVQISNLVLQGFPGILIVVGHFLDSFLLEVNFILWELDSTAPFLVRLLGNSHWICPNNRTIESDTHYIKFISLKKESIKCPTGMRTAGIPCMPFTCSGSRNGRQYSMSITDNLKQNFNAFFDRTTKTCQNGVIFKRKLQGFPGVLIAEGHFIDSFLREMNLM